jgi:uncharacterized membrane protein YfcA
MTARAIRPSIAAPVHLTRLAMTFLVAVVAVTAAVNPVVVGAALLTGILNTAAGGGAIVTFLTLTAVGVPALTAHATGQLVTPASFLGAFRLGTGDLPAWPLLRAGCFGALLGVGILKLTPAGTFQAAAPFFLVPAAILVVVQEPVKRRVQLAGRTPDARITVIAAFLCGVYAGLIGVGVGTLALVVLGLTPAFVGSALPDVLRSRNVLLLGMAVLVAVAFAATGLVDWELAALLAPAGALGGWLGTRLVTRLPVPLLRAMIAATAVGGAIWMALR